MIFFLCVIEGFGRKEGTKELTHITHKAPIAISPADRLYFFPTYSYSRKECAWLSHFYIESNKELEDGNLIIRFINGFAVKLEISKTSFENQQNRTAKLRTEYEDRRKNKGILVLKRSIKRGINIKTRL